MTQPDNTLPESAANAGSFKDFAAKTKEDYDAEIRGAEEGRWGGDIADVLFDSLRAGISFPFALLEKIANQLLAPFGLDDEFEDAADALNRLVSTLTQPLQLLGSLVDHIEDVFQQMGSRVAGLEARVNALQLSLDDGVTETGGYDNCSQTTNFTAVHGSIVSTFGYIRASGTAVARHNSTPATDRCGAGIKVTAKQPGMTRLIICGDSGFTNYAALEFRPTYSGDDEVLIVTGTSPTEVVAQTEPYRIYIPTNTFWEIRYEPFDEDSETSNMFRVWFNGDEVVPLRWRDEGNVVAHGADRRHMGFLVNGWSKADFRRGFAITDFTYYDWLAAAPA